MFSVSFLTFIVHVSGFNVKLITINGWYVYRHARQQHAAVKTQQRRAVHSLRQFSSTNGNVKLCW